MANPNLPGPLLGWPLLPLPDINGEWNYPTLDQSVRQMIQIILRTRPGEQLMRPGFGAGLENYLHEPNTLTTRRRIRDLITASIQTWEPRIALERVEVTDVAGAPTQVRVEIAYRLLRTGAAHQMGLTMELEA